MRKLLLGPPGCGKTTRLLLEMERALDAGTPPSEVAFVSFTRAAVREARDRACEKFGLTAADLPHFRTLHSAAYRALGLRRREVFGRDGLRQLAELTGEDLTGRVESDAPTLGERGDALLFLDQYARNALVPLDDAWHAHGAPLDRFRLERFVRAYAQLRSDLGECDFTDMLERYARGEGSPLPVSVCFLDEAQDLTPLQWRVVDRAFTREITTWVAGDDDQAIFHWAGADARALLEFQGEREVLAQSYRLPRAVWRLAREVSARIEARHEKLFHPADREGAVEWVGRAEEVDLSAGTWFLLARTRRQLASLARVARDQGVAYSVGDEPAADPGHVAAILAHEAERRLRPELPIWHDALTGIPVEDREYLLACLRRGESLTRTPRVRVDTVHGVKGKQAQRVLLLTDLNERVRRGMELDPDAEQRVLYVAVTRASEALYLVTPTRSRSGYQM